MLFVRIRTLIFLGAGCAVALSMLFVPGVNSRSSRFLWNKGFHTLAYFINTSDADLALQEGNFYFGGGAYDLAKAQRAYRLALALKPGVLWGHYQLARIYFVEGRMPEALAEIDAELAANPANLRSLYVRGLIEMTQVNLAAAETDFTRFIAWAPLEWGGYNDLAFVLAKEGKYRESEVAVLDAFAKVPHGEQIAWLWNSLGVAQLNELHYTQAATSFTKAAALARQLSVADWRRAYSGDDPAQDSASLEQFTEAIDRNLQLAQAGASL